MSWPLLARSQQRLALNCIGIVLQGRPYYLAGVEGLREGLTTAGLEECRDVALIVRDAMGDLTAAESAPQRVTWNETGWTYLRTRHLRGYCDSTCDSQRPDSARGRGVTLLRWGWSIALRDWADAATGLHSIVTDLNASRYSTN